MSTPGFWDDRQRAAASSRELDRLRSRLSRFRRAQEEVEEISLLFEMASEAGDDDELRRLESRLPEAEAILAELRRTQLYADAHDPADCYLSINAGAGGTDSHDWASMLLRMYVRFCERTGFTAKMLEVSPAEEAGLRSATLEVSGEYAYGRLKTEIGVHRLVRISPFDSAHRRHTSFAAVSVIPVLEEEVVEIDPDDLRIDTYRSSGAGGQHVNVTDSAVRITHLPTGIVVSCQNERSQHQNKETAMRVLHSRLGELLREQQAEKLEELHGEQSKIEWGSQIRSYVLHPYRMAKDHRTEVEVGDVDSVLDGDLDRFLDAALEAGIGAKPG
ncbi:MAG: peptide chain release factor 2 [Candidatus Bipolaricaulota bacterium]|nr:MAG: peptide chain release factor 2 [Candidatus Bipolaricaulota bacterium]